MEKHLSRQSRTPLLLVNGWGGTKGDWGGLVKVATRTRDVVVYDQRGIGESGMGEFSVERMAEDCREVMRAAAYDEYDLVGFSLGGLVAQQAVFDGAPVRRLVLASTSAGGTPELMSRDFFDLLDDYDDDRRRKVAAFLVNGLPQAWVRLHVDALKKVVDRFVADETRTAAGLHGQKRASLNFNAGDRLATITQPTLVLHGDVDPVLDPQCATLLQQRIPNAKLLLLAGVGHHAYIQEGLAWLHTILDFLDD